MTDNCLLTAVHRLLLPLHRICLEMQLHDPLDQLDRERLIERKLDRAFTVHIRLNLTLERLTPRRNRVQRHMLFLPRKMDEVPAVQRKGSDLITDSFFRLRRERFYQVANLS